MFPKTNGWRAPKWWALEKVDSFKIWPFLVSIGTTPHPVTVTTRMIPFLVGNPYKPSFVTVTGWGVDLRYLCYISGGVNFRGFFRPRFWRLRTFLTMKTICARTAPVAMSMLLPWAVSGFWTKTGSKVNSVLFWRWMCLKIKGRPFEGFPMAFLVKSNEFLKGTTSSTSQTQAEGRSGELLRWNGTVGGPPRRDRVVGPPDPYMAMKMAFLNGGY